MTPPEWVRGPIKSSLMHALVVVLGLWPYKPPDGKGWILGTRSSIGPFGMVLVGFTDLPWLWLFASGATLVWYWVREYAETGLRPKPKLDHRLSLDAEQAVYRTIWQRYDTWTDVGLPTLAHGVQLGILVPIGIAAGWPW